MFWIGLITGIIITIISIVILLNKAWGGRGFLAP